MLLDCEPGKQQVCMQALELWQSITGVSGNALRSPHAEAFYRRLDWQHVLGWPAEWPSAPAYYKEYITLKQRHPEKLIGHRTNPNLPYWFVGVDAVIVTELLDRKGEGSSLECVPISEKAGSRSTFSEPKHDSH